MLNRLHIQNYAIIDEIEIDFSKKLNIITGETGAGKSILMGALSLILGDRADLGVLRNREKKCVSEAVFLIKGKKNIQDLLAGLNLDAEEDELVIRREINVKGKSRAFVNDTPVNLDDLRNLSSMLVDLHQQFDTRELGDAEFQREVIDAMAGHFPLINEYLVLYRKWLSAAALLAQLRTRKEQFTREFDYNSFLLDELSEASFQPNELEEADIELNLLSNAEGIKTALEKVSFSLLESEEPIVTTLKSLANQLQPFAGYHLKLPELISRLQSAQIELKDLASEVDNLGEHVQFDPARIEALNQRIALGYKLLKKHGVKTTDDLLQIRSKLEADLQRVLNIDEEINATTLLSAELQKQATVIGQKISKNRQKQVEPLETRVNALLIKVGMPNARIKVRIMATDQLVESGLDTIEILFDANKSNRFEPIRKVASGGELSRLMLCIKSLVAESLDLPTLIFDEIDSGISGEAARQVGIIMKALSSQRQVISITHQPQIAGKADAHFFVYKQQKEDTIKTGIRLLDKEERITAIAKMLSGEKPTAAAIQNAREMISYQE